MQRKYDIGEQPGSLKRIVWSAVNTAHADSENDIMVRHFDLHGSN